MIDISAANDPDAHEWLDRTLYRIVDGWHVWDLTETPDLRALHETTWIGGRGALGDRARKLLVRSTQRRAWTPVLHGRRVRVTAHPITADDLAPEEAFRPSDEPLVILVEGSDRMFTNAGTSGTCGGSGANCGLADEATSSEASS